MIRMEKGVVLGPECRGKTAQPRTPGQKKYRAVWAGEFRRAYAEAARRSGGEVGRRMGSPSALAGKSPVAMLMPLMVAV